MKKILYIAIILILALGPTVLNYFGWRIGFANAPFYQKAHPAFWLLFLLLINNLLFRFNNLVGLTRSENLVLLTCFLIMLTMAAFGFDAGLSIFPNSILLPIFLSMNLTLALDHSPFETSSNIRNILVALFITNSCIAIVERVIGTNFFPFTLVLGGDDLTMEYDDISEFRSTALLGHPLSNALCTTIVMSFILISKMPEGRKYMLFMLGYIAILCFNTRSSILAWGGFIAIYMANKIWDKEYAIRKKVGMIIIGILGMLAVVYLIFNTGLGGRLLNTDLLDNSGSARLDIFNIFQNYELKAFLFGGVSPEQMLKMAESVGLGHIENYWLIFTFRFGIIYTLLLSYGFYKLFQKYLSPYPLFERSFVLIPFLLISSTNNSLATGVPAIAIFFLCCISFDPQFEYLKSLQKFAYYEDSTCAQ